MKPSILSAMAALLFVSATTTGCPHFAALTPPPPGHRAQLNSATRKLTLSVGVAMAFNCTTPWAKPCSKSLPTVSDPSVVKVLPAHLQRLDRHYSGSYRPTSLVAIGLRPGTATITVGDQEPLAVVVVE